MLLASRKIVTGDFKLYAGLKTVDWLGTAVIALAAIGMFLTIGCYTSPR